MITLLTTATQLSGIFLHAHRTQSTRKRRVHASCYRGSHYFECSEAVLKLVCVANQGCLIQSTSKARRNTAQHSAHNRRTFVIVDNGGCLRVQLCPEVAPLFLQRHKRPPPAVKERLQTNKQIQILLKDTNVTHARWHIARAAHGAPKTPPPKKKIASARNAYEAYGSLAMPLGDGDCIIDVPWCWRRSRRKRRCGPTLIRHGRFPGWHLRAPRSHQG